MNETKPKTVFDERDQLKAENARLRAEKEQLESEKEHWWEMAHTEGLNVLRITAELEAARESESQWKAQATRRGISYVELFAEKQTREKELSEARNENANLKDENDALKRGEGGELLTKAQEEGNGWKEFFERVSESFRKYREEVESGVLYASQRKVMFSLIDERKKLAIQLDAAWNEAIERCARMVEAPTYIGLDDLARCIRRLAKPTLESRLEAKLDNLDAKASSVVGVWREGGDVKC